MTEPPQWCPPPLAAVATARSTEPLGDALAERVSGLLKTVRAEHERLGEALLVWMHLSGREQAVALAVRTLGDEQVLECLSLADAELSDTKLVSALATNGQPRLAGLVCIKEGETNYLFARASNLVSTLDDGELDRMLRATARLADDWESRHTQGGDQW